MTRGRETFLQTQILNSMRSFFRFLVAACCLLLVAVSCRTTSLVSVQPELEQQWIGRSYADVVDSLGKPEREVADVQDGKILVYESGAVRFYMNSDSFCYAVRSNKQRTETKFSMSRSLGLGAAIAGGLLTTSSLIQLILLIYETGYNQSK